MKNLSAQFFGESRPLLQGLKNLKKGKAPRSLLPAVLRRLGLGDSYFRWRSPLGPVFVAYNKKGISAVMRAESGEAFERSFRKRFPGPSIPRPIPPEKAGEMKPIGLRPGKREKSPSILNPFPRSKQAVLQKGFGNPRSEVRPYGWIAREIGRPKAVRAVGTALAKTR